MAFNRQRNRYENGSFSAGSRVVTGAGVTRTVTEVQAGEVDMLVLDGGPMNGGEYAWITTIPVQESDKLWYQKEPFASRTGSGEVLSRAEQEARGIPQPSGWIGDRPTYDTAATRTALAAGFPLPPWAIMGGNSVSVTYGSVESAQAAGVPTVTGQTGLVVQEVKAVPAPPVPPPPLPPPPAPPPAVAVTGYVNAASLPVAAAPAPAKIEASAVPSSPPGAPVAVGIGALIAALLVLG